MPKLETIGKVLLGGWGNKVAVGFLLGILEKITPEQVASYIQNDRFLFDWATDKQWTAFRGKTKQIHWEEVTLERVLEELGKRRIDLAGVIINYPKGKEWLKKQISEVKKRLTQE